MVCRVSSLVVERSRSFFADHVYVFAGPVIAGPTEWYITVTPRLTPWTELARCASVSGAFWVFVQFSDVRLFGRLSFFLVPALAVEPPSSSATSSAKRKSGKFFGGLFGKKKESVEVRERCFWLVRFSIFFM